MDRNKFNTEGQLNSVKSHELIQKVVHRGMFHVIHTIVFEGWFLKRESFKAFVCALDILTQSNGERKNKHVSNIIRDLRTLCLTKLPKEMILLFLPKSLLRMIWNEFLGFNI